MKHSLYLYRNCGHVTQVEGIWEHDDFSVLESMARTKTFETRCTGVLKDATNKKRHYYRNGRKFADSDIRRYSEFTW